MMKDTDMFLASFGVAVLAWLVVFCELVTL